MSASACFGTGHSARECWRMIQTQLSVGSTSCNSLRRPSLLLDITGRPTMPDTVLHPLLGSLGCRIGHTGGTPEVQARMWSLRQATINKIAGRIGPDLSAAEYQAKLRELEAWEQAGNQVALPPPVLPASFPHARPPTPPPAPVRTENVNAQSRWPTWPAATTKH